MSEIDFPIDLVYLWVDGSDPAWCDKKNKYIVEAGDAELKMAEPARWRDNDELRYSLRGVEQFAPWINHIFLVTDGQCPKWLDRANPKISIVDHKDFIPQKHLPVFAADAIEACLPYIPGLSEHFLFANDDMFFGRDVLPDMFFTKDGTPIVAVKQMMPENFALMEASQPTGLLDAPENLKAISRLRANIWIAKRFGIDSNWEAAHVIDPYRKSYMLEVLEDPMLVEAWEKTRDCRFRSPDAMQRIIFSLYDAAKGRTILKDNRRFRELKRIFARHKLPMLLSKTRDFDKVLKIRPEQFCFFNFTEDTELLAKVSHDFFEKYFPVKSSFEI